MSNDPIVGGEGYVVYARYLLKLIAQEEDWYVVQFVLSDTLQLGLIRSCGQEQGKEHLDTANRHAIVGKLTF